MWMSGVVTDLRIDITHHGNLPLLHTFTFIRTWTSQLINSPVWAAWSWKVKTIPKINNSYSFGLKKSAESSGKFNKRRKNLKNPYHTRFWRDISLVFDYSRHTVWRKNISFDNICASLLIRAKSQLVIASNLNPWGIVGNYRYKLISFFFVKKAVWCSAYTLWNTLQKWCRGIFLIIKGKD